MQELALTHPNFRDTDLSRLDLSGINFGNSDITRVNFSGCILRGTDLSQATGLHTVTADSRTVTDDFTRLGIGAGRLNIYEQIQAAKYAEPALYR